MSNLVGKEVRISWRNETTYDWHNFLIQDFDSGFFKLKGINVVNESENGYGFRHDGVPFWVNAFDIAEMEELDAAT